MTEIGLILELLQRHAHRAGVLVTLTHVTGSSYRRPGARLLWLEDGTRTGGISGGCLEEDVLVHARAVFQSRQPKVVIYDTTAENDLVWGTGTGCDGQVTLLLEYIPASRPEWLRVLAENYRNHQPTALDVRYRGGALGTTLAVAASDAPGGLHDVIPSPERLIVCGAGDDAQPLVAMAATLGWDVIVVDSRPAHATPARFPAARQLLCCAPAEAWKQLPADRAIPVVIMTHRYRDDRANLPLALARSDHYVGLLGPRKRTDRLLAELVGEGFEFTEEMKRVLHAPVGLALGATTPAGVALAILAEIQACLAQGRLTPLRDRPGPIHAKRD